MESTEQQQSTAARGPAAVVLAVMHNELIFEHIAKHVPVAQLLSLRRTCQLWNRAFLPHLRVKHPAVELATYPYFKHRRGEDADVNGFCTLFKSVESNPFTSYELIMYRAQDLDQFFTLHGKVVKTLNVRTLRPNSAATAKMKEIIFELAPSLSELRFTSGKGLWARPDIPIPGNGREIPSLRKVVFRITHDNFNPHNPRYEDLLTDTIRHATGLQSLKIEGPNYNSAVLGALASTPHGLGGLKTLKMYGLGEQDLRDLIELATRKAKAGTSLQLERFVAQIEHSEGFRPIGQLLTRFLASQAGTLRELKIRMEKEPFEVVRRESNDRDWPDPVPEWGLEDLAIFPVWLPKLPNLRTLALKRHGLKFEVKYLEGSLANNFLSLRKLVVEDTLHASDVRDTRVVGAQIAHGGVTHLVVGNLDTTNIQALFPAITRLEVDLVRDDYERVFGFVWTVWPALEVVRVNSPRYFWCPEVNLGEYLTGVPAESMKAVKEELESLARQGCVDRVQVRQVLTKYKTRPGVSDLQHLRRLTLDFGDHLFKYTGLWRAVLIGCKNKGRNVQVSISEEYLELVKSVLDKLGSDVIFL